MRIKSIITVILVLSIVLSSFSQIEVKAETKTIVVPDDFPTITDAIGNATEGDVVFVRKGDYGEHMLEINKTISLIGEDANITIINNIDEPEWDFTFPPPTTVAVLISANNVKISGFTITNSSFGIVATGNGIEIADNIFIDNTSGMSISGNYTEIIQNNIVETEKYIIRCKGSHNNITCNKILGTTLEGICLEGSFNSIHKNTILGDDWFGIQIRLDVTRNTISENNITGCSGIFIERGSNNVVCRNRITNGGTAITIGDGDCNTFYANYIANNYGGALVGGSNVELNNNVFYHNNFINNTIQVGTEFPTIGINYFDNGVEGNYWSDYKGTDNNDDNIGNTPYIIDENRKDNYPFMNPLDIETIPEFQSWTILPLFLIATVLIIVFKNKLTKSN